MKTIPISRRNMLALVDDEDFPGLSRVPWYLTGGYAVRTEGGRKRRHTVFMHRRILGLPDVIKGGVFVDHINGNKLDNRKSNLRMASWSQNCANRGLQKNNTSGFKGVTRIPERWRAAIKVNGKDYSLGCFDSREAAAKAYNEAATRFFKEFARLNSLPQTAASGVDGQQQTEKV